jgi:hypothetical protein
MMSEGDGNWEANRNFIEALKTKSVAQKTIQVEDIIKNALLSNGYPDDCQTSAEEMASIVLFELQDNNILVARED